VQSASLSRSFEGGGFPNYEAFVLPISILFAMSNDSAGLALVTDIERGYFDKLMVTPISRWSVLVGGMGSNIVRALVQGLAVTAVAMLSGARFATGIAGGVAMVLLAVFWGVAYAGIGMGIALRTGSPNATQASFFFAFPMLFLTSSFAPEEALSGWLRAASRFNPVTYLLRGMRSFAVTGLDASDVGIALGVIALVGTLTTWFAVSAMRARAR
jgi:ABC-2 type transport system permease protein